MIVSDNPSHSGLLAIRPQNDAKRVSRFGLHHIEDRSSTSSQPPAAT
jgi:hypothetical protein